MRVVFLFLICMFLKTLILLITMLIKDTSDESISEVIIMLIINIFSIYFFLNIQEILTH